MHILYLMHEERYTQQLHLGLYMKGTRYVIFESDP